MEISRLSRITAILTYLQSKRLITASEMADKFEVSVRTIYRDIRALEEAGVPICTEEGKGYSLMEGYRLPPVSFTEQEANALITAEKFISRNKDASLVQHYGSAITKIKSVLRHTDKGKAELLSERVAFMLNFQKHTTSNHLSKVQVAITNFQTIQLHYHSISKDEVTQRRIEPLALYHTKENWILIAWCKLREENREFRLDRIKELTVLTETFSPRTFDLMGYFLNIANKNATQKTPLT